MKSMAVRSLDDTSPSSSLSAAAVSSRKGTPKGLPALLNKLVRAVLISKPLQAANFLADYLDAELNRRTLCQLQDSEMTTVCDLEVFDSEKVENPSSRITRAARKEQLHDSVSASNDEQSCKGCARRLESKCVAVQTDRNHLRYMTKSPFLQKMEAELISSVVENLNQDHECRCNCPPPPLFWYQITRPQVLRKCRGSLAVRKKVAASTADDKQRAEDDGDKEIELLDKKTVSSIDGKASKLHAENDAGLARIIDRELKCKKWQRLPTPPRRPPPPPLRPQTPPLVERPLKVDSSSQVETLVIQPRPRRDVGSPERQDEIAVELAVAVEHKYVQTMDDDDIFRPEEKALDDKSDMPSADHIAMVDVPACVRTVPYQDLDVPACIACPDDVVSLEDASPPPDEPIIDWSPFWVPPLQSRSSTAWLNIDLKDVSDKDYDTDWNELTRAAVPVKEEPLINWLAIDLQPQPAPHTCGREARPPSPPSPSPSEPEAPSRFPYPSSPAPSLSSVQEEDTVDRPAVQPSADWPDDDRHPLSGRDSPATMMTPDVEDVLTGCEDPSLLIGPDEPSTMVVLSWKPIVIKSDTCTALPLDIPEMVSQCASEPSDKDYRVLPDIQNLNPQEIIQELAKKWEQISVMEVEIGIPHPKGASPEAALMERNEVLSIDSIVKLASEHSAALADADKQKQVSDHEVAPTASAEKLATEHGEADADKQVPDHEVAPTASAEKLATEHGEADADHKSAEHIAALAHAENSLIMPQLSDHKVIILGDILPKPERNININKASPNTVEQKTSYHEEFSPTDEVVEHVSDINVALPANEMVKQGSDSNMASANAEVSDHNVVSGKGDMQKQVSDHKELALNHDLVEQKQSDTHVEAASPHPETMFKHDDDASPTDEAIKQASGRIESVQEIEMLKQVFGEAVISSSSMVKAEATPTKSEEKEEPHSAA